MNKKLIISYMGTTYMSYSCSYYWTSLSLKSHCHWITISNSTHSYTFLCH